MTYFCFEIATVLFECLLVHIFFNGWFGLKSHKHSKVLPFMVLYFISQCAVSLFPLHPIFRTIYNFILVLVIAVSLYETTHSAAVYSSFLFATLAVISEFLCFLLLNALAFNTDSLMIRGNARAIYLVLAKTAHFAVVLITSTVLRKNRAALTLKQVAPLLPCLIVSIYICTVFFYVFPDGNSNFAITLAIALVGLLYINGVVVLNTQLIKHTIVEIEDQKLASQHYDMQTQYYRSVVQDREETRALWHDVKKHVTAIGAIVSTGDIQAAKTEYEAIYKAFDKLGTIVDIENEVLNSILYHNFQRAKTNGISVRLDARVSPCVAISAVDLSVIIGNTFDNAIEECIMLDKEYREISVTLAQQNNMLFYEIKNPCMEISHKKLGKHRGYGLRNVIVCVDKYGGSLEKGAVNGTYTIAIRLNCPTG